MSRVHTNVIEVGTIREKSTGAGISIPSTIISDLTLGTVNQLKTNIITVADGSYLQLNSSMVQMSGFIATPSLTTNQINENNSGQGIIATCNFGVTGTKKFTANTIETNTGSTMQIGATGTTINMNKVTSDIVNVNGDLTVTHDIECDNILKTDFIANTTGVTGDSILVTNPLICAEELTVNNGKNTHLTGKFFIDDIDYLARTNRQVREVVYNDINGQIVARPYAVDNKRMMFDEFEYTQPSIITNLTLTLPSLPTSLVEIFDWLIPSNYVSDTSYGILQSNYPWRVRCNHLNSLNVATLNGSYASGLYVHIPSSDANGAINFCMYRPFNCYKGDYWGGFHATFKIGCGNRTNGPMYWGLVDASQNPFDCTGDVVSTYFLNCLLFLFDPIGNANNHIYLLHRRFSGTQGASMYDTGITFAEGTIYSCSINWDDDNYYVQFVIDDGTSTNVIPITAFDANNPLNWTSFSPIVTFSRPASTIKDIVVRSIKIDHFIVD